MTATSKAKAPWQKRRGFKKRSKPVGEHKLGIVDKKLALFIYPNAGSDTLV